MKKYKMKTIISILIITCASLQLFGIGEITYNALWNFYKFHDHSGGHVTVSYQMTIFTYICSVILISTCVFLHRISDRKSFYKMSLKFGGMSLISGLIILTSLLLSPAAELVKR